jgi:hypothetical protein
MLHHPSNVDPEAVHRHRGGHSGRQEGPVGRSENAQQTRRGMGVVPKQLVLVAALNEQANAGVGGPQRLHLGLCKGREVVGKGCTWARGGGEVEGGGVREVVLLNAGPGNRAGGNGTHTRMGIG